MGLTEPTNHNQFWAGGGWLFLVNTTKYIKNADQGASTPESTHLGFQLGFKKFMGTIFL